MDIASPSAVFIPGSSGAYGRFVQRARRPVTPWRVDWEKNSCVITRGFGDKEDMSALVIERFGPTQSFQLLLIGRELKGITRIRPLTVRFGDGRTQVIDRPITGTASEKRPTLFIPAISLMGESRVGPGLVPAVVENSTDQIAVSWKGETVIDETGPLDQVFAEMRKCTEDMFRVWKLDKNEQYRLRDCVEATESPASWLRPNDYPLKELRAGKQAIVSFVLLVYAQGIPTDCTVSRSYGDEAFNRRSCDLLLQRARFKPAINTDGQPVTSVYFNTISWIVP